MFQEVPWPRLPGVEQRLRPTPEIETFLLANAILDRLSSSSMQQLAAISENVSVLCGEHTNPPTPTPSARALRREEDHTNPRGCESQ